MVGTARSAPLPTLQNPICVSLPSQTKKGGTHGQEESRVARRGAARRKEEMVGPQDGSQILSPQDHQVEGEGRTGGQVETGQESQAEATHRHQPSPRRG